MHGFCDENLNLVRDCWQFFYGLQRWGEGKHISIECLEWQWLESLNCAKLKKKENIFVWGDEQNVRILVTVIWESVTSERGWDGGVVTKVQPSDMRLSWNNVVRHFRIGSRALGYQIKHARKRLLENDEDNLPLSPRNVEPSPDYPMKERGKETRGCDT